MAYELAKRVRQQLGGRVVVVGDEAVLEYRAF